VHRRHRRYCALPPPLPPPPMPPPATTTCNCCAHHTAFKLCCTQSIKQGWGYDDSSRAAWPASVTYGDTEAIEAFVGRSTVAPMRCSRAMARSHLRALSTTTTQPWWPPSASMTTPPIQRRQCKLSVCGLDCALRARAWPHTVSHKVAHTTAS
jgi:hypothetical protein